MSEHGVGICVQSTLCITPLKPFITGKAVTPNTLTGQLIANEMYQWIRDTVDIPGATSATYDLTSEDIGHLIRVRMHFTDADNNFHTVTSKPVGPIQGGGATFVNSGAFAVNAGGAALDVPMPSSITPGNLLFVWMSANATRTANPVAGWTFLNASTIPDNIIAYRIADGSEGASVTFTYSGNSGLFGQAIQFSGVNTTTPLGAHNTVTGTGTTASNSGLTTSSARGLVLGLTITNSDQVIPAASGWTPIEGGVTNGSTPYGHGARTVTKFVSPAGATGPLSVPISSISWRVSLYEIISRTD
ncbi:hypothetical protein V5F53_20375 [Xanthobacter sp. V4C-4]|uniref:hypothetical protein n=1 Tax=Xanthobacter cornucopiae TaxID=3119924 RepID=UPI00372B23B6